MATFTALANILPSFLQYKGSWAWQDLYPAKNFMYTVSWGHLCALKFFITYHSEDRIRNGAKKLLKSKQKATQGRLDMFFKPVASPVAGQKRKVHKHKHTHTN